MPPRATPLPDCYTLSTDGKHVWCKVCGDSWIQRGSWKAHDQTAKHRDRAALKVELEKSKSDRAAMLAATYNQDQEAQLESADFTYGGSAPADVNMHEDSAGSSFSGPSHFGVSEAEAQRVLDAASGLDESWKQYRARMRRDEDAWPDALARLLGHLLTTDVDEYTDETIAYVMNMFTGEHAPELSAEEIQERMAGVHLSNSGDYSPYPNKTVFLLDLLDSLQRLRLSDAHIEMILFVMREAGARDVPSLYALRQIQKKLRAVLQLAPIPHESVRGHRFFTNSIKRSISMHFGNPQISKRMVHYPEVSDGAISEHWQTRRRRMHRLDLLTPMAINSKRQQFFVRELAQLTDGRFVVPFMWITRHGDLHADSFPCTMTSSGLRIELEQYVSVPLTQFARTFPELRDTASLPLAEQNTSYKGMPHPLRDEANGRPIYSVFLRGWADDVSGNVSKQYNKHINVYAINANMPAALLRQEFFVLFFSTSQHASAAEQYTALRTEVLDTISNPVVCMDAATESECRFRLIAEGFLGDNPQQSDDCSHMGGQSLCNCRKCHNTKSVPKTQPEADAAKGWYAKNFERGKPRRASETLAAIKDQIKTACEGVRSRVSDKQTETGCKDSVAEYWIDLLMERAEELKKDTTRHWSEDEIVAHLTSWLDTQSGQRHHPLLDWIGIDPHRDTPIEILHTILLGIVKYVWHMLTTTWTAAQKAEFVTRLQATDMNGLSSPPMRAAYMMQYSNGLIGKHFKALAQSLVFHVHGMTSANEFALVKAVGHLCAYLWNESIPEKEYTADLKILIANVLDAFAAIDPLRILEKAKLHLLVHLEDDVPLFGPPLLSATEIFESFNAVFRMCSVLSNHQAPSRDIALSLSNMDRMKYILCGGIWKDGQHWAKASDRVTGTLFSHAIVQRHLGWAPQTRLTPGDVRLPGKQKRAEISWENCVGQSAVVDLTAAEIAQIHNEQFYEARSTVSQTGDVCAPGTWVIYTASSSSTALVGRVKNILTVAGKSNFPNVVVLERFVVGERLHPAFDMPVLARPTTAHGKQVIPATAIRFVVNVQHDCRTCGCEISTEAADMLRVMQERQETNITIPTIKHQSDNHFVINLHAIHNAVLIRQVLPIALTKPRQLHTDRAAKHTEWEAAAFVASSGKRIRAQEK